MINPAICPSCKRGLQKVRIEHVTLSADGFSDTFRGVTFSCPSCRVALGASFDPVSLAADVAAETVRKMKKIIA